MCVLLDVIKVKRKVSVKQFADNSATPLWETHMPHGFFMGSHSVTCHPTEVRIPPLPPAEAGNRFSDPAGMQG